MPLIILGLIVILGACLLIYYQLGPKVTLRLKSGFGGFAGFGGASPAPGDEAPAEGQGGEGAGGAAGPGAADSPEVPFRRAAESGRGPDSEKVLYVFGDGEREERSLREDDGPGENE